MKRIISFVTLSVIFSYLSCLDEEKDFEFPRIFTSKVENITNVGAKYSAQIEFAKIQEVTEYGFIWGLDPNLTKATISIRADDLIENNFSVDIRSNLIAQKNYYVRSYVKYGEKTVFGNIVSFISLGSEGPKITGLSPEVAAFGDTIRVLGKNFASNAILKYGKSDITANIFKIEKNLISFILPSTIPENPDQDYITVSIEGNISTSPTSLKLDLERMLPKIISISPMAIKACDTVTINGKNFTFENKELKMYSNYGELKTLKYSRESIVFIVNKIPKNDLSFYFYNGRFVGSAHEINITELRPEVLSISTNFYRPGEVISVKGKNFPHCDNSLFANLKQGSDRLEIISKSSNEIKLKLPDECYGPTNIVFTISDASNYLNNQQFETPTITPAPPEITAITPTHASIGDEIVITGKFLKGNTVNIIDTLSTTDTEIRGILNDFTATKDNGFVDVEVSGCGNLIKEDAFKYDPVEILDFEPKVVNSRAQVITITGKNFSKTRLNKITIGSRSINMGSLDNTTIEVYAGNLFYDITKSYVESTPIIVNSGLGSQASSTLPIQINCDAIWTQLNDFPGGATFLGVSFALNGKGYVGRTTSTANFWQYDPSTNQWQQKANYPGAPERYRMAATANGRAYVGLGVNYTSSKEWWEYDPVDDSWTRKADFPGADVSGGFVFEILGKIYVGAGNMLNRQFWEYDPLQNIWTRKSDIPSHNGTYSLNFSFKGKGYRYSQDLNGGRYEYEYNPIANTWSSRSISYYERCVNNSYYIFDDYVIAGGQSMDNYGGVAFMKIIPGEKIYGQNINYAGILRMGQIGFVIGSYGYWGLGIRISNQMESLEVWKFDPTNFLSTYPWE